VIIIEFKSLISVFSVYAASIEYEFLDGIWRTNILGFENISEFLGAAKLSPYFIHSPFQVSR